MATKQRTQAGTLACLCCGHDIPAKQSENGTLNLSCQWCDFTGYAKAGTEAHKLAMAKLKNKPTDQSVEVKKPAPAAPPPAPAPAPAPAAPPAPRKRNSIFDMG